MSAKTAKEAVEQVEGHDAHEPRGVKERYIAWVAGRADEGMAFMVAGCKHQCSTPLAERLFSLHVMEASAPGYSESARKVKDWGYQLAAEFAATRRGSARVRGYRVSWARQAARDGLCLALWGHLRGTGLAARSAQYSIGERPYQRVRDHVRDTASALLLEFETMLSAANDLDVASYR
jgi:hypothetical protein